MSTHEDIIDICDQIIATQKTGQTYLNADINDLAHELADNADEIRLMARLEAERPNIDRLVKAAKDLLEASGGDDLAAIPRERLHELLVAARALQEFRGRV